MKGNHGSCSGLSSMTGERPIYLLRLFLSWRLDLLAQGTAASEGTADRKYDSFRAMAWGPPVILSFVRADPRPDKSL